MKSKKSSQPPPKDRTSREEIQPGMEERVKVVDARGLLCPRPLILTKTALRELPVGETISILVDNDTSRRNIERFIQDNGATAQTVEENGVFRIQVNQERSTLSSTPIDSYCSPKVDKRHVIVIRSRQMGTGPADLGEILLQALINTIEAVSPLPAAILFYNSGIHLTVEGSPLVGPLRSLQAKGVQILVCGTCAEYFQVKEKIQVGTISNMYAILEAMTAAGHIISP